MNFISYKQMINDSQNFCRQLPRNFSAVIYVPRSGVFPASIVSMFFNINLLSVSEFVAKNGDINPISERLSLIDTKKTKKILVIDDSISSGKSMKKIKKMLEPFQKSFDFFFSVLYKTGEEKLDFFYKELHHPRTFEWNMLNSLQMKYACVDIDGVLCEDPSFKEYNNDPKFINHLKNAKSLIPITYPIRSLVTCRLEKYRGYTVEWLEKHNIAYDNLYMMNYPSPEIRRQHADHAKYKAKIYAGSNYRIFIESSIVQAKEIANLSKKPVFCIETMEFIK